MKHFWIGYALVVFVLWAFFDAFEDTHAIVYLTLAAVNLAYIAANKR
jgi:hypothetical protein